MKDVIKKFRNFQDEVFGSGVQGICEVQTYRNGEDYAVDFSIWFSKTRERMSFSWNSWSGETGDWEEFKENVRKEIEND